MFSIHNLTLNEFSPIQLIKKLMLVSCVNLIIVNDKDAMRSKNRINIGLSN